MFGVDDVVGGIVGLVKDIFGRIFPNKDEQTKALSAFMQLYMSGELAKMAAQSSVLTQALNSKSWFERSWRGIAMLTFTFIIANNYILVPYSQSFGWNIPSVVLNDNIWVLLKIGLTGYVTGSAIEKGIKAWKQKA